MEAGVLRVHDVAPVRRPSRCIEFHDLGASGRRVSILMMEELQRLACQCRVDSWRADILIVTTRHRALLVLRGTRAMQTAWGLSRLCSMSSRGCSVHTVPSILGSLISASSHHRRGLSERHPPVFSALVVTRSLDARAQETRVSTPEAATDLARHRIGALIAFEQDANLDEFSGAQEGFSSMPPSCAAPCLSVHPRRDQ